MDYVNVCYYPTTVVIVDDNKPFIDSLPLKLSDRLAYRAFVDPHAALDYVNGNGRRHPRYFDSCIEADVDERTYGVRLNISGIRDKVEDDCRFTEPSVLIVDYSMAAMDGLEFCRSVTDPHVQKIMLTGVADEKVGVEALNESIINYYVKKNAPNVFSRINGLIPALQEKYLFSRSKVVRDNLRRTARFMDDPAFVQYFAAICRRFGIAEYYFAPNPTRFLLLTAAGEAYELIIYTDDELQAHYDIAEDYEAPVDMLREIQERSRIPYFYNETDGFYHYGIDDWPAYFFPADLIDGQAHYYCAVIPSPRLGSSMNLLPYEQHLRRMVA